MKRTPYKSVHLMYWSLLCTTFFSSCFLFFAVASENYAPKGAELPHQPTAATYPSVYSPAAARKTQTIENLAAGSIASGHSESGGSFLSQESDSPESAVKGGEHEFGNSLDRLSNDESKSAYAAVSCNSLVENEKPDETAMRSVTTEAIQTDDASRPDRDALRESFEVSESLPDMREVARVTAAEQMVPHLPLDAAAANEDEHVDVDVIDPVQGQGDKLAAITEQGRIINNANAEAEEMSTTSAELGATVEAKGSGSNESSDPKGSAGEGPNEDGGQLINFTAAVDSSNVPPRPSAAVPTPTATPVEDEVPIPVFSEWAQQKQLLEEQQAQDTLAQQAAHKVGKHNLTHGGLGGASGSAANGANVAGGDRGPGAVGGPNGGGGAGSAGHGRPPTLKLRSKNYASPDCGAKIIASNADATNTGAVLSASKDEYMLSPCGARIWFVVELCEPVQAQHVDLANFELFSSSPRNFTVAVASRFPTRDWSNVGRFHAADQRTVQSFTLRPQLFGKFVRVDIHSHYSKEHFCPLSLFRVFGTSEFEAFETADRHDGAGGDGIGEPTGAGSGLHGDDDSDDDDEEQEDDDVAGMGDGREQGSGVRRRRQGLDPSPPGNLFKSASDAVLSIVKKAAEVLTKPASSAARRRSELDGQLEASAQSCRTPVCGRFQCAGCDGALVERVNHVLSCAQPQMDRLLRDVPPLRAHLRHSGVCAHRYGLEMEAAAHQDGCPRLLSSFAAAGSADRVFMDVQRSYYLNLLPLEYVGALCQLLQHEAQPHQRNSSAHAAGGHSDAELPLNLTIDRKVIEGGSADSDGFKFTDETQRLPRPVAGDAEADQRRRPVDSRTVENTDIPRQQTGERVERENAVEGVTSPVPTQIQRPPDAKERNAAEVTTAPPLNHGGAPTATHGDVNIFNLPPVPAPPDSVEAIESSMEGSVEQQPDAEEAPTGSIPEELAHSATSTETPPSVASSWDSAEVVYPTTVSPVVTGNGSPQQTQQQQQKATSIGGGGGGPQSESVFIRLANRIKALERNMSLSGQYLEELSRRYKKQVEELQQTLVQQTQQVRVLEEHSRQHSEVDLMLAQRNKQLHTALDDMTRQLHACVVVIICSGAFVLLVTIVGLLSYRSVHRQLREVQLAIGSGTRPRRRNNVGNSSPMAPCGPHRKLQRRKSYEDFSSGQRSRVVCAEKNADSLVGEKQRRPSEEVMLILKECVDSSAGKAPQMQQPRQRKISICYDAAQDHQRRRGGAKHSWPQAKAASADEQSRAMWPRPDSKEVAEETLLDDHEPPTRPLKGQHKQRPLQHLKRQESAPSKFPSEQQTGRLNVSAPAVVQSGDAGAFAAALLDEEDLDNFIPNSDLAYNEFMPEGPSGYQIVCDVIGAPERRHFFASSGGVECGKGGLNRSSRLIAAFKSPFSRNTGGNGANSQKSKSPTCAQTPTAAPNTAAAIGGSAVLVSGKPPHQPTSWEWYRTRRPAEAGGGDMHTSYSAPGQASFLLCGSPNAASLDAASLSEVHFPLDSAAEDSFRHMLQEAIRSPGATGGSLHTNGAGPATCEAYSHGSSASSSGSSSANSSTLPAGQPALPAKLTKKKNIRKYTQR